MGMHGLTCNQCSQHSKQILCNDFIFLSNDSCYKQQRGQIFVLSLHNTSFKAYCLLNATSGLRCRNSTFWTEKLCLFCKDPRPNKHYSDVLYERMYSITETVSVYCAIGPACFNLLKPTGHVMHQQFNIRQLYVLPTLYLCVLYLSENKQRLVSLTA